jgi:hypothetical protein
MQSLCVACLTGRDACVTEIPAQGRTRMTKSFSSTWALRKIRHTHTQRIILKGGQARGRANCVSSGVRGNENCSRHVQHAIPKQCRSLPLQLTHTLHLYDVQSETLAVSAGSSEGYLFRHTSHTARTFRWPCLYREACTGMRGPNSLGPALRISTQCQYRAAAFLYCSRNKNIVTVCPPHRAKYGRNPFHSEATPSALAITVTHCIMEV